MNKLYLVQMEEVVVNDDSMETIEVWEGFYDLTDNLKEAKSNALQLLDDIKEKKVPEVFEVNDANNVISICIAVYNEKDHTILDVIEMRDLAPEEWNIKCGSCSSYCSGGTCYKYGSRVNEDNIANSCWHSL